MPADPTSAGRDEGVIVPPSDLTPIGAYLTPDELRARLEEIGKDDPEAGHGLIDDLMRAALTAIRDGHDEPRNLAHAVLVADQADFPRWYA